MGTGDLPTVSWRSLPSDKGTRTSRVPALIGLVLLSGLLAIPTLDNGFSLDDYNWLERASFRDSNLSFLLQPEAGQVFNPVGRGAFLALFGVAGTDPLPYRLAILALHAANVCLLFLLVERVFGRRDLALVAAFLFAVARSYDEALFWVAAYFHPLNATLCLAALLAYLSFLESGSRGARVVALLALAAALLTKAPAFPFALLLLLAPLVVGDRRWPGWWRSLLPFAVLWTTFVAINLALGLEHSYLLQRGYYRFGWHMVPNLADYLVWMILPFGAVAGKLGAGEIHRTLVTIAWFLVPATLAVTLVRADRRIRFFVGFGLLALLAFLPFTFEPTSRYTYLSAAGFAPVLAVGALALGKKIDPGGARSVTLGVVAGGLLTLLALTDTMIVDNDYEYRERMELRLVADVKRALPQLPANREVRITGLPRFGIDPGIHLEAALRLAYEEPALRLEVTSLAEESAVGDSLRFDGGRILAPR